MLQSTIAFQEVAGMVHRCKLSLLFIALLLPLALFAQSTASLTGTVTDPSGAAVPGARVACVNVETGQQTVVTTTSNGLFLIPNLPVGLYDVTITHEGFQKTVHREIHLLTGESINLTSTLRVGATSDSISISGSAPLIETTASDVHTTVDSRQMSDLPLNGRNAFDLAVLSPGASATDASTTAGQQDNSGLTVNGFLPTQNDYRLDGGAYNNLHFGSAPTLPNPDTLQEFTILTSNFSAENRGGGAVVKLTTRSGTNQFHGTLFEFFRNTQLDARNFFSDTPLPYKQNQYGGTVGGPIRKDRLFFFGSYQGTLQRGNPSPELDTVPTAAQRAGDFSKTGKIIVDPKTGQPFAGDIIPTSRMDPIGVKLLQFYPLPDYGTNGYLQAAPANRTDYQWMGKIDYYLGSKDIISGRYFWDANTLDHDEGTMPGFLAHNSYYNRTLLVSDTHTFKSTWILHTSFNYVETNRHELPVSPTTMQALGANVKPAIDNPPDKMFITLNGYTKLFTGRGIQFYPNIYEFHGDVGHVFGRHLVKFGLSVRRDHEYASNLADELGAWTFTATASGNSAVKNSGETIGSLLLGLPATFVQSTSAPENFVLTTADPWVQDDWRISKRLTLNLGLRWEPWLPPTDTFGPLAGFVPGVKSTVAPKVPTGMVFSGDPGIPASVLHNHWATMSPRLGFAWDVTGNSRFVVRGGYGFFRAGTEFFGMQRNFASSVPGRSVSLSITNPLSTANPYGNYSGTVPFPTQPLNSTTLSTLTIPASFALNAFDPYSKPQYTQSWNLTIERQLWRGSVLSVSYIGNHFLHGMMVYNTNPAIYRPGATTANTASRVLYPGFASVVYATSAAHGFYDSFQTQFIKRAGRGLTLWMNYTFAKALDITSSGAQGASTGIGIRDPLNLNLDKGPADFNIAHQFKFTAVYDVPKLQRGVKALRLVTNGWQLNAISVARTGLPFTCRSGVDNSLSAVNLDHCDQSTLDISRPDGASPVQMWFNPKAFTTNAIGTWGNVGRNSILRPGSFNVNLSVFRQFPVTERARLDFRMEMFNAFNHTNFDLFNSTGGYVNYEVVTSPTFAQLTSASDPRLVQFALKLRF